MKTALEYGQDVDHECPDCGGFMTMGPDDWECPYGCTDVEEG